MRILVVTQSFFPDVDGGSGRVVFELARRLRSRGHEITLVGERCGQHMPSVAEMDGMRIVRYGSPLMGQVLPYTFTSPLLVHAAANSLFRKDRFDLVWCHHYSPGLGGIILAGQKGIPALFTYHASRHVEWTSRAGQPRRFNSVLSRALFRWWADVAYGRASLQIEKKCLEKSDRITVLSDFSRRQMQSIHPRQALKVEVIPGGVDTERFRPASDIPGLRSALGLPSDAYILLTVRRLIRRMGLENLIDAVKIVLKSEPNTQLIICGKGYLMQSLEERVSRSGLAESVKLLGYVEDGLLPDYYAASDLFVLPTLSLEGFGMVTLEALACGTPVLGTAVGATPEILGGLDPDLILDGVEPEYIARGVLEQKRRGDTEHVRARCRQYVEENFRWDSVTDKMERTMAELVTNEGN